MNKQSGSLETRTAIVVGGSLGGLTAAALLKREGWAVTVFERSHMMLDGAGAGIVVHDSTVRHLVDHRGLNIDDFTCTAEIARVYGPGDEILFEEPSDYRFTSWTTLYRHLVDSVGRDNYRLNELMVALDQDEAGARVTFASGRTVEADLVVCADGIGSAARTLLFGEVKRNYAGYVGWRGIIEADELGVPSRYVLPASITYGIVPNSHIVSYPIPAAAGQSTNPLVNYVWYRNVADEDLAVLMTASDGTSRPMALQPGMVKGEHLTAMREAATAELPPTMAQMVCSTRQPFLQAIYDIESPHMVAGRIAIIGDAASVARPHAGAGTAKAAENGWTLVQALRQIDDVVAALAGWERSQLELGRNLVERSAELGRRAQFTNTWTPGDPELKFGLYGPGR
ncbi:FAD binding domain-containing protein [Nocardioides jensenii]|uniref:FAD binding domain-containing protein n=1 Tax=Nocardioides jensenii TaxID=1843 RepID=UPI00082E9D7F|nr:FAD-dependent monooxygenase [Nocardioides jensenii]